MVVHARKGLFSYRKTAIDQQSCARYKRRLIARQKKSGGGDLLRRSHASQGLRGGHLAVRLFRIGVLADARLYEWCLEASRTDAVSSYSFQRVVERETLRKTHYGELRDAVRDPVLDRRDAADRRHIYDHAIIPLTHAGDERPREGEHPPDVDRVKPVEIVGRRLLDRPHVTDTRVVDENVQLSVFGKDGLGRSAAARIIGHVQFDEFGAAA